MEQYHLFHSGILHNRSKKINRKLVKTTLFFLMSLLPIARYRLGWYFILDTV